MHTSPFRSCDHCGATDTAPTPYYRPIAKRAWTLHAHTRKLTCPKCRVVGRREDAEAARVLQTYRTLLERRIVAEPQPSLFDTLGEVKARIHRQFSRVKESYPDAVLLFRSGDRYFALGTDADTCAHELGLTSALNWCQDELIRVASFPFMALDQYLPRLVRAGHRVAICDELEGPPVPSTVQEPYGDAPLRKTHRIALRGDGCEVDVHKQGDHYYGLDGTWSIGVEDRGVQRVVLRYKESGDRGNGEWGVKNGEVGMECLLGEDDALLMEPMEQYRRIKPLYKDALLILRDHQGYLMLYRDAERAAAVLQVEYTGNGPFRIAKSMLERVLDDLVKARHRVAVVIDPNVDDPRNSKQVDLWDALATEATVVEEPFPGDRNEQGGIEHGEVGSEYRSSDPSRSSGSRGAEDDFGVDEEVRLCLIEQPYGTRVDVQVNWLGWRYGGRRTIHLDLNGGRASSETGYRSHFLHVDPSVVLTEDLLIDLATEVCDERFAELNPGQDGNQGVLF